MKKALEIVSKNKIYIKILKEVSLKYKSFGKFTGSFTVKAKNEEELYILQAFDDKVFEHGKAKLKVVQIVELFEGVLEKDSFLEFLKYVLNDEILSNKETKKLQNDKEQDFYNNILKEYKSKDNIISDDMMSIKWFKNCVGEKLNGYTTIKKYYNEANKKCDDTEKNNDLNILKYNIISVLKALDNLPYIENKYKSIPVFATEITRNPHFFDRNQMGGTLLKYGLCYILNMQVPDNIRELNEIYYNVGLLKDEISNHTTIYNLKGYKDLKEIKSIREYNLWNEPLQISISNLLKVDILECVDGEVFIFENPSVFEQVKKHITNKKSLICTSGQLNLSSYIILDKISNLKKIYYAGDFDPEGIHIAYKIKERYKEKVEFMFYTKQIYEKIKSEEDISERRLNIIKNIKSQELEGLIEYVLKYKKSAYQEMIISKYIEFINK